MIRAALTALLLAAPAFATDAGKLLIDNYPPESLRLGEEGDVGLSMDIGANGKINGCQVSKTSGYARLDRAACDLMLLHVTRVSPPTKDGRRVAAQREGAIGWRIPPGQPRLNRLPPRSPDTELALAAEKITCAVSPRQGSIGIKQKVCLTRRERDQAQDYARRNRDAL